MPQPIRQGLKKENIEIVLVSSKNPGNIGAVARAMKNLGFHHLRLVNPVAGKWLEAIRMACGAEDVLERAKFFTSLKEALTDLEWVVGTTARKRRYQRQVLYPGAVAELAMPISQKKRIALVFGSEKYGLTNEEMGFCHQIATIPCNEDFSSLNLAQAVLIFAWEFSQRGLNPSESLFSPSDQASNKDLQDLFLHLEEGLFRIGFLNQENSVHMMLTLKTMIHEKALTCREAKILRGMLRNLLQHISD